MKPQNNNQIRLFALTTSLFICTEYLVVQKNIKKHQLLQPQMEKKKSNVLYQTVLLFISDGFK